MTARTAKVEIFKGHDGLWYAHRRKITDHTQGYIRRRSARAWAARSHPELQVFDRPTPPPVVSNLNLRAVLKDQEVSR